MFATLSKRYLMARGAHAVVNFHLDWLVAGLILVLACTNLVSHKINIIASVRAATPIYVEASEETVAATDDATPVNELTPRMQATLDHVARRFRVSQQALMPIFAAAQDAGRERHIDPMLLIAMISIESSFNPYSQSVVGAQGLMQVIPRYHQDKVPEGAGEHPFLDPVTNVHIGAHVLQESMHRYGGLMRGLQQYGGALNDEEQAYANKVLAEKNRLEQASRRSV